MQSTAVTSAMFPAMKKELGTVPAVGAGLEMKYTAKVRGL